MIYVCWVATCYNPVVCQLSIPNCISFICIQMIIDDIFPYPTTSHTSTCTRHDIILPHIAAMRYNYTYIHIIYIYTVYIYIYTCIYIYTYIYYVYLYMYMYIYIYWLIITTSQRPHWESFVNSGNSPQILIYQFYIIYRYINLHIYIYIYVYIYIYIYIYIAVLQRFLYKPHGPLAGAPLNFERASPASLKASSWRCSGPPFRAGHSQPSWIW